MSNDKYAALDAAILSAITTHDEVGFSEMLAGRIGGEARALETRDRPAFRVLDARLQALRKAGKIKSTPGRRGPVWVLAEGGAAWSTKSKPLLADAKIGDAIWSGGKRWIVSIVRKTVISADRPGFWAPIRRSWRLDGSPASADAPAEVETPEQFARWEAEQAAAAERDQLAAESAQAHDIALQALVKLSRAIGTGPAPFMTHAKACALERFVDQLTRDGE